LHIDYARPKNSETTPYILDFSDSLPQGLVDLKICVQYFQHADAYIPAKFFMNLPCGLQKLDISGNLRVEQTIPQLPPTLTFLNIWPRPVTAIDYTCDFDNSFIFSTNLPDSLTHLSLNYQTQWGDHFVASMPRGLEVLLLPQCPFLTDQSIIDLPNHLHWLDLRGSTLLTQSIADLLPPGEYPKTLFPYTKGRKQPSVVCRDLT